MNTIQDDEILALFFLVRDNDAAGVTDTQRNALEQLKHLSRGGNLDATYALRCLSRLPDMHPFLREVLAA